MRKTTIIGTTVVAAVLALAAPAGAARGEAAYVRDCSNHVGGTITITSARNISCGSAAHHMRRYKGSIRRRFRTPGGFTCVQTSGVALGGAWRCTRRTRAFRFDFGD